MGDIRFSCPHCGQHIVTDAVLAGTHVTCPTCNGSFDAPVQTETEADSPPPDVQPQPPPQALPSEGTAKKSNELGCGGGIVLGIICTIIFVTLGPKHASLGEYALAGLGIGLLISLAMALSKKGK